MVGDAKDCQGGQPTYGKKVQGTTELPSIAIVVCHFRSLPGYMVRWLYYTRPNDQQRSLYRVPLPLVIWLPLHAHPMHTANILLLAVTARIGGHEAEFWNGEFFHFFLGEFGNFF